MPVFSIKNLSVVFQSDSKEKFELSVPYLSISNKGLVSFIGKSGCGKSTLLNVLYGIEKPTSGSVFFRDKSISQMKDKSFSSFHSYNVSMVFQHYNLFPGMSSLDNVMLPLLIRGVKKKDAHDRAVFLFKKFSMEKLMEQNADTLSGGEKQRVAILRSLITSPKAILCDEPTGALDIENSHLVMKMFKEISKDIVVIMVSHNLKLVEEYSDRIIEMADGKIISDTTKNQTNKFYIIPKANKPTKDKWSHIFVKKKLKENFKRNIIASISSTFGFVAILLAIGFSNGSSSSRDKAALNNYGVGYAKASLKTFYDIENSPLKYEKSVRPDISLIDEKISIPSLKCDLNLDYAFSPYPSLMFEGENILNFEMQPIYDEEQDFQDVVINEEMLKLLDIKKEDAIGKELFISSETSFSVTTDDYSNPFIKDEFSYTLSFYIKDVVEEFAFLNSPKIYYSYLGVKDYLKGSVLTNISRHYSKVVSVYDFIDMADEDDIVSSYSTNLFITDKKDINSFFKYIEELKDSDDPFQITSTPYEIKVNYINFMNSFSNALFVFVIIAFIGVNFIAGMLSLSSFIESKKEAAILTCLGARNSSIMSIYLKENNILILLSYFIAVLLSIPIQLIINKIVKSFFGLENIISIPFLKYLNIPFLLPVGLLLVAVLISSIFVLVPLLFYRHISLSNELKDE